MILETQIRHVVLPLREYGGSYSLPLSVQVLRVLGITQKQKLHGAIMKGPDTDLIPGYILIDLLNKEGDGCDIGMTVSARKGRNDANITIPIGVVESLGWKKGDNIAWSTDGTLMEIDNTEIMREQ